MKLINITIFVFLSVLTLTSCGVRHAVYVNSVNYHTTNGGMKYFLSPGFLLPGERRVSPDSTQYTLYAFYTRKALEKKGFVEVFNRKNADVIILLCYGTGKPETETYNYSLPIYEQTGVSSSTTSGTVDVYGDFSSTTTYTPNYSITGYSNHTGVSVNYRKYFALVGLTPKVYDNIEIFGNKNPSWITIAQNRSSRKNLKVIFPILVGAATHFIGTNTDGQVRVVLRKNDKRVIMLMK